MIVKDILTGDYRLQISNYLVSRTFPWFCENRTISINTSNSTIASVPFFSHLFVDDNKIISPYNGIIDKLKLILKEKFKVDSEFKRVEAQLLFSSPHYKEEQIKIPNYFANKGNVIIYQVHKSDSKISIFNETYSDNKTLELTVGKHLSLSDNEATLLKGDQLWFHKNPFNSVKSTTIEFYYE